jgi:hypothetical protein
MPDCRLNRTTNTSSPRICCSEIPADLTIGGAHRR